MERKYIAFVWCKGMRIFKFKTTPKTDTEKICKEAAEMFRKQFFHYVYCNFSIPCVLPYNWKDGEEFTLSAMSDKYKRAAVKKYEKLRAKRDELKLKRIAYREELLNIQRDYKISIFSPVYHEKEEEIEREYKMNPAYHEKVVEIGRKYRIEKLNNDINKTIEEIRHISPAAHYF